MTRQEGRTRSRRRDERGVALIATVLAIVVLSALGAGMLTITLSDTGNTSRLGRDLRALSAADAGVENVIKELWADYVAEDCTTCTFPKSPGVAGDLNTYIDFLNREGVPEGTSYSLLTNQPLSGDVTIQQVSVTRTDTADGVTLAVNSVGNAASRQVTVDATIRVEGRLFPGFNYGLLANNVNCIMCHARFDNVSRYYNKDTSMYGKFDRVKIAALQNLMIRTGSADSVIAGTLYTPGGYTDNKGTPLTAAEIQSATLDAYNFDSDPNSPTAGKIIQDGSGNMTVEDLVPASGDPLPPLENLYLGYPTDPEGQVDGELPTSFPAPVTDSNGNRLVDLAEWSAKASTATGNLSGGVLYGVPAGSNFTGSALPGSGTMSSVDQNYTGNLILVGTSGDPLVINGTVAVDGDVVITGTVKGTGTILASGNIYVVGDTTYADCTSGGDRTYGVACDGTKNTLALTAGENILIGDYLTPKGGNNNDVNSLDSGGPPGSKAPASFTQSELTLFNKAEYAKAQADPSYVPRYYQLRDGDPVYLFTGSGEHGDKYDSKFTAFSPNPGDAVVSLSPQASGAGATPWISEQTLKQLWINDNNARASGTPFQIDGLLYSSNAVFALTRKDTNTNGTMRLNGAMVSADVGVLVPGTDAAGFGLQLNYDQRISTLLKLKDPELVRLVRRAWKVL
jgi:Tfp pilus assembly protein PilX